MTNFLQNWEEYKPSKAVWFWSCAGAAALTIIVGFGLGGWVTSSTASEQVSTSTDKAVAQLAASICANRFMAAADAEIALSELKEVDAWKQDNAIEKGGWVTFAKMTEPVHGAAKLCVEQLFAADTAGTNGGA